MDKQEDVKMDTRKYSSPMRGDISLNKAAKGRGWKGLKGQMALALAVSLWIGSSGVAMAQEIVVDEDLGNGVSGNTAYPNDKTQWCSVGSTTPNPNNNKVTVNAGVTVDGFIKGSFDNNNNVTGNEVIVNGTVNYFVSGGQSYYANAQNNIVTINGTVVGGDEGVYGGFTVAGSASGNRVTINGTVNKDVYGGHGNNGATGNFVTVNGKVDGNVYGGGFIFNPAAGNMTDNDITLNGATVGGSVYGGYKSTGDVVTGNTLNLSGANTAGAVQNFATININSATWGTPVLTAKIMQNTGGSYATIDASNLAFTETTDKNIMGQSTTLLKGANLTNNILNQPAAGKGLVSIAGYTDAKGVKFDATASGAISVDSAKDLIYTINKVDTSKITLGSFAWGDTDAMPTGWTASGTTQIDAANLSFKNPESVTGTQTLLAANAELA